MTENKENSSPFGPLPERELSVQELKAEARLAARREFEAEKERKLLEEWERNDANAQK